MVSIDYKSMDNKELTDILLRIKASANNLMDCITELKATVQGYERRDRRDVIIAEYATLKKQLKEIYHYTQLGRNQVHIGTFYSSFFCPAIMDCYIHCNAKINETNLEKLFSSLYDISDYIIYYLPRSKA